MKCTLTELRRKEIIETKTGTMLGRINDIEIDTEGASVVSVIVYGRPKLFGLLGRDSDMVIRYSDIDLVGRDTVLISSEEKLSFREAKRGAWLFQKEDSAERRFFEPSRNGESGAFA